MSKMTLKVLFAQRTEQYEGQFAPEVLASVTDLSYHDYSDWFDDQIKKAQQQVLSGELASFEVIDIEVDQDEIRRRVTHQASPLIGEIKDDQAREDQ